MYWNDTHILIYLVVAIIGAIGGQIIDYLNKTFLEEGKILSKESIKKYKGLPPQKNFKTVIKIRKQKKHF